MSFLFIFLVDMGNGRTKLTVGNRHVWNAEQKEWIRQDQVTWNQNTKRGLAVAHAPRSLPREATNVKGLKALKNLF